MLKTAERGFGHVHFFVRKHPTHIEHRSPHRRTKMHINTSVIALFTVIFSLINLSNDVPASISVPDYLVKHFSVVVPLDVIMKRATPQRITQAASW
jgi:hypothetical protein